LCTIFILGNTIRGKIYDPINSYYNVEEHACFLLGIVLGLPIPWRDIKGPIVGDVKGIKNKDFQWRRFGEGYFLMWQSVSPIDDH
jgi:hypothetical protein